MFDTLMSSLHRARASFLQTWNTVFRDNQEISFLLNRPASACAEAVPGVSSSLARTLHLSLRFPRWTHVAQTKRSAGGAVTLVGWTHSGFGAGALGKLGLGRGRAGSQLLPCQVPRATQLLQLPRHDAHAAVKTSVPLLSLLTKAIRCHPEADGLLQTAHDIKKDAVGGIELMSTSMRLGGRAQMSEKVQNHFAIERDGLGNFWEDLSSLLANLWWAFRQ